jgi:DNA polymerase-3 subunit alpha
MYESEDIYERYWVNKCIESLVNKGLNTKKEYVDRLEEEADIKKTISEKLETNMFSYPITLQHYVDLFWECGSTVGAGRGSSCSGLNHYLLGITQLDPIKWDLPFWRYLNKERVELGSLLLILPSCKKRL